MLDRRSSNYNTNAFSNVYISSVISLSFLINDKEYKTTGRCLKSNKEFFGSILCSSAQGSVKNVSTCIAEIVTLF